MNLRLANTILMLRMAIRDAIRNELNSYGIQYATTKSKNEKEIIHSLLKRDSEVWDWLRVKAKGKLTKIAPELNLDDANDLVGEGVLAFIRNDGLGQALNNFDINKTQGGMEFSNWLYGRLMWSVEHRYKQHKKEKFTGVSKQNLLPSSMPSIDAPINGNPKYIDEHESGNLPDFSNYAGFNQRPEDMRDQYVNLLKKTNREIRLIKENGLKNKDVAYFGQLNELQEELVARLEDWEKSYGNWAIQKAPAQYSDRANKMISDLPKTAPSIENPVKQNKSDKYQRKKNVVDTNTIEHRLQSNSQFWDGMPDFIEKISINAPAADIGAGRWYKPGQLFVTKNQDPEVRSRITKALIAAFNDAKILLSPSGFKNAHLLDVYGRVTATRIKEWFPNILKKEFEKYQVPIKAQQETLERVNKMNLRVILETLEYTEEMQRMFTYNKLSNELGVDMKNASNDEKAAIIDNVMSVMEYNNGVRPRARKDGQRVVMPQAAPDYDQDAFRDYLSKEYDWTARKNNDPLLMGDDANFFTKRVKKSPEMGDVEEPVTTAQEPYRLSERQDEIATRLAHQYVLKQEIERVNRLANRMDKNGFCRQASILDAAVGKVVTALSV